MTQVVSEQTSSWASGSGLIGSSGHGDEPKPSVSPG